MTAGEKREDCAHDAARKSEFDEDAFCGVERRDLHRGRKGPRGGKDAGAAGSLHPRQYASRRRHHGAGGFGWGGGDRDQFARGCQGHHHHREQDQLYRRRERGHDRHRDRDAGASRTAHASLANPSGDRGGPPGCPSSRRRRWYCSEPQGRVIRRRPPAPRSTFQFADDSRNIRKTLRRRVRR
jgi:hypothetical protein